MKLVNVFLSMLGIAGALLLFQNCGESIDYGAYDQSSLQSPTAYAAPELLDQSSNLTKNVGETANFSASFSGGGLTYQWYKGSTPLSGKTTTLLTLPSLQTTSAGTYKIEATNSSGTAVATYTLTVNAPAPTATPTPSPIPGPGPTATPTPTPTVQKPVITQHLQSPRLVNWGDPIFFQVVATGANLNYEWKLNGNVVGTNSSSYSILSASPLHSGDITVRVYNSGGSASSSAAIFVNEDRCFDRFNTTLVNCQIP